jgi:hypothetical protein
MPKLTIAVAIFQRMRYEFKEGNAAYLHFFALRKYVAIISPI